MPEPDLIELFEQPLNRLGIRYVISGSVAAMLYGEPRLTHDIDLIVFLRSDDIERLQEAFPLPEFYLPRPTSLRSRPPGSAEVISMDSQPGIGSAMEPGQCVNTGASPFPGV